MVRKRSPWIRREARWAVLLALAGCRAGDEPADGGASVQTDRGVEAREAMARDSCRREGRDRHYSAGRCAENFSKLSTVWRLG